MKFTKRTWVCMAIVMTTNGLFFSELLSADRQKIAFEIRYTATVSHIPKTANNVRIWIPYPKSDAYQQIYHISVDSPYPTRIQEESEYGNSFLYLEINNPQQEEIEISMEILAERAEVINKVDFNSIGELQNEGFADLFLYLRNNYDKTSDDHKIKQILSKTLKGKKRYIDKVKALYDYVYDNMDYSKAIEGFGKGDVGRACTVKSGNCIDFHSLFIALATEAGLIAREVANIDLPFEDGVPNYCKASYHCNVEVFLPNHGWFPMDISHAKKAKRGRGSKEFYFGSLDNLRLRLGHGRNLLLAPPQQGERLNRLMINPYVEIDGKKHEGVAVSVLADAYEDPSHKVDAARAQLIGAGEKAETFSGESINGRVINMEDYLCQQPVFINFFTTWCGRCNWETKGMIQAASDFKDVLFLRVNLMEKKKKIKRFVEKYNIPFPVLHDENGDISNLYGVKYVPTNIIIDKEGVVRFAGGILSEEDLRNRLEEIAN